MAAPQATPAPGESAGAAALLRDLARLDARLARAVATARERGDGEGAGDPYRGLYVSPDEAEALLGRGPGAAPLPFPGGGAPGDGGDGEAASPLARLARRAGLSPLDAELLLVALAPDLELRYERIYAFLQDDVTRRRPTVDLALSLLCPGFAARAEGRRRLAPSAPLRRLGLLHLADDGQKHPPLLARTLKADERVVDHLLEVEETDAALVPAVRAAAPGPALDDLVLPDELKRRLELLAAEGAAGAGAGFHLRGGYGVGKAATAGALCAGVGVALLEVDVAALLAEGPAGWDERVRLTLREALLRGAAVLWEGWDALAGEEKRPQRVTLLREAEGWGGLHFFAGEEAWDPADALAGIPFYRVELPRPGYTDRVRLWKASLNGDASGSSGVDAEALANKFRFSGGQIRDAATTARDLARARDPGTGRVTPDDLHAACRLHSNPRLAALARKVTPRYAWSDIVLPPDRVQQLREIVNHMKYRSLVFGEWGFDRKLAMGKGLNALFAGPSGTGKTMAAEIVAGELGMDLYKVDLSTVVSKYIGETEKNLGRIFAEAETSNAILFFDEADSLFARRSEVRDSHDRYANLETSYLLQKMEEYEGVVILATNYRKNLDEAFVRRLHFTIDFPFPGERERLRIWQSVWPGSTPRGDDLSLEFIARRVEVAGGNIRNIALAAAFLAADDGRVVTMAHLVRATRREYQKMGKVLSDAELGDFARLG